MFFADTSLPDPSDPATVIPGGWAVNSYTFIENPEDPLQQTNFGQNLGNGYTIPDQAVAWAAGENQGNCLWGGAMATQQNDPTATWGYLIFEYYLRAGYVAQYNTLVNVTATESDGLVTNRIVDQLFTAPDLSWGSFSLAAEPSSDYVCILSRPHPLRSIIGF